MNQCINENGGVSAIWQMAFDGSSNLQNKTLQTLSLVILIFQQILMKKINQILSII